MVQDMSDFSIPGVTDNYNTSSMIEEIMRLERVPLQRLESEASEFRQRKVAWGGLRLDSSRVQDAAKKLFGFQNPFDTRVASSSNERSLSATASRRAMEGNSDIQIISVATPDRFLSAPQELNYQVPEGNYEFKVGDSEVSIRFRGGDLAKFAETIERRSNGLLTASVIRETANTLLLSIGAAKTGKNNRLIFKGASLDLAEQLGIVKKKLDSSLSLKPGVEDLRGWNSPLIDSMFVDGENGVTILPGGEAKIPIPLSDPALILEFDVTSRTIPDEIAQGELPPSGPRIPPTGTTTFQSVTVRSAPSLAPLPSWSPPPPPPKVSDDQVLYLEGGGEIHPIEPLQGDGSRTVQLPLSELGFDIEALNIQNRNTHREVEISNLKMYNPQSRGDWEPVMPLSLAGDAEITIDDISVFRESNEIDDLLPGVTLNLKRPTSEPLELTVEPDIPQIKDSIINFVGYYNKLMAEIVVLTGNNPELVDQIDYYTNEERAEALEKLGIYQGDSTLRQMKSGMQMIMMEPYSTDLGNQLSLLAQIGISTNTTPGRGTTNSRLRGYLEINEPLLDDALENSLDAVKQLFGHDSNGDLIVDTGAAHAIDSYLGSYGGSSGILANKISTLDGRIERTEEEISDYNIRLADKERELRAQFGVMQGALETMRRNSDAIENFNNQNRGR